jgi:hypothetical protein
MDETTVRIIRCVLLPLLCAQALCQTPEQRLTPADSLQSLAGTFESVARGDSFFGGGTSNAAPLFTVTLGTNGTYFVFCASVSIEPHMDGDHSFIRPGNEFGTWRWDRQHSEVVFTATNRSAYDSSVSCAHEAGSARSKPTNGHQHCATKRPDNSTPVGPT